MAPECVRRITCNGVHATMFIVLWQFASALYNNFMWVAVSVRSQNRVCGFLKASTKLRNWTNVIGCRLQNHTCCVSQGVLVRACSSQRTSKTKHFLYFRYDRQKEKIPLSISIQTPIGF